MKKQTKADAPNVEHPNLEIVNQQDGRTRLRVQFDITYKGKSHTPTGESETEPDLTIKLGQLLERHSRGKEIPMQQPLFFDTEIPTFNDLTDIDRYKEQLKRRLVETENFLKRESELQEKAKKDEEAAKAESQEESIVNKPDEPAEPA